MKLNRQIVMAVLISAAHVGIGIWLLHYAPSRHLNISAGSFLVSINLNLIHDKPSNVMPQSAASTSATKATTALVQVAPVLTTLALPIVISPKISPSESPAALSTQSALLPVNTSIVDASQDTQVAATSVNVKASSPPRFDMANLNNPPPHYPPLAKRLGEQGKVMLRVLVDAAGQPQLVEIHTSSGSARLDIAAIEAVKRWQFIPAREGDMNIVGVAIVPINFQLS
jgi:protein TonB